MGTWLVPTLSGSRQADHEPIPDWVPEIRDSAAQAFGWALNAGVPTAMGTDCPAVPHGHRLEELDHMHRLGMAPMDGWMACRHLQRGPALRSQRQDYWNPGTAAGNLTTSNGSAPSTVWPKWAGG
jgi:hypothetical protein